MDESPRRSPDDDERLIAAVEKIGSMLEMVGGCLMMLAVFAGLQFVGSCFKL